MANNHEGIYKAFYTRFNTSCNLQLHFQKNIFSGLKKYVCDSCGKAFALGYQLKKHIEQVHEGKIYSINSFFIYEMFFLNNLPLKLFFRN